jgi:hypothetical protein
MSVQINEKMESGTGEEEALLLEMIAERDRKIHHLVISLETCESKLVALREKLQQTKTDAAMARISQIELEGSFQKQKHSLAKQLSHVEKGVIQQNGGLHVYANILKEAAPESADSSYVIRMQSQLCKAMHCMGALQHQLEILNFYSGQILSALRGSMAQIMEEKTMVELQLMNELMQVDTLKRRMEEGLRRSLEEFQASQRVFSLSQSFTTQESEDNDDDDSAEIDEDLLLEILQERKEDIAAMEQENAKQEEQIKQLKAKIVALDDKSLTNGNHQ